MSNSYHDGNNHEISSEADGEIHCLHQYPNGSKPKFPSDCIQIVRLMEGNHCCIYCNEDDTEPLYASVAYGALFCSGCANRFKTSTWNIKSLMDDEWTYGEVLSLLEGGNSKFRDFCTSFEPGSDEHREDDFYLNKLNIYRDRLLAAVERAQEDRKPLVDEENYNDEAIRSEVYVPPVNKNDENKLYAKELPMMSLVDFHISVLGKAWPDDEIKEIYCPNKESKDEDTLSILEDEEWEFDDLIENNSTTGMPSNPLTGSRNDEKYVKELPILSVADFYTSVLGKEWPDIKQADDESCYDSESCEEWIEDRTLYRHIIATNLHQDECIINAARSR
mmetsp:Transcript_27756/g.41999  ORF Transcript_27756/g.41999 Transcript_27756/m.41999 type:complete len:334 (+) Transcript_27756:58-1059(+)